MLIFPSLHRKCIRLSENASRIQLFAQQLFLRHLPRFQQSSSTETTVCSTRSRFGPFQPRVISPVLLFQNSAPLPAIPVLRGSGFHSSKLPGAPPRWWICIHRRSPPETADRYNFISGNAERPRLCLSKRCSFRFSWASPLFAHHFFGTEFSPTLEFFSPAMTDARQFPIPAVGAQPTGSSDSGSGGW